MQYFEGAFAIFSKAEVEALDDRLGVQASANQLLEEFSGPQFEQGGRCLQDHDMIDAISLQQFGTKGGRAQQRLERFGTQDLARMRIESDHHARSAQAACLTNCFGDERLMPAMHAVEIAHGDGAPLTFPGHRLIQRVLNYGHSKEQFLSVIAVHSSTAAETTAVRGRKNRGRRSSWRRGRAVS